ncbi:hypothetical protein [Mycolicibacterium thermoresistibile]
MLILAAGLTVASVVALVIAIAFSSSLLIAGICVGLAALGLLLLIGDAMRTRARDASGALPVEHPHTAGDELFGEHEVERDIEREEHVISQDMLGDDVPNEELVENLRHGGHGPGGHHEHRPET